MSVSEFDSYRPPEEPRRKRKGKGRRRAPGSAFRRGGDGSREMPMVPEPDFTSYYGRPIVKAPPWEKEIGAYLFLGGLAGGSSILAFGAELTDRPLLRRNMRLSAITAAGLGTVALVADLGRPERFLHMMRTIKPTSPMSLGSWLLAYYATHAGVAAAAEVDRMTHAKLPLGPLRPVLRFVDRPAAAGAAASGAAPESLEVNPLYDDSYSKSLAFSVAFPKLTLYYSGAAPCRAPARQLRFDGAAAREAGGAAQPGGPHLECHVAGTLPRAALWGRVDRHRHAPHRLRGVGASHQQPDREPHAGRVARPVRPRAVPVPCKFCRRVASRDPAADLIRRRPATSAGRWGSSASSSSGTTGSSARASTAGFARSGAPTSTVSSLPAPPPLSPR